MTVAFITTCCMTLFLTALTESMGLTFTSEDLNTAAKLTFANVILLSLIFAVIDAIRRKITVKRPVKQISDAAAKIMKGDFSVRLCRPRGLLLDDTFDEITESFNKMAKELASLETLREDLIANVSHEMKTPLAAMQNYAVLLQSPSISDVERVEYAKGVAVSCRKAGEMLTNILKLDRLENCQIYPMNDIVDLREQICECLLRFESVWEEKSINVLPDLDEGITVRADGELLSLIWNNLFSNAFKFTDIGGKVSVSLKKEDRFAVVAVKDTGCGMRADVGEHIFEKFYQGDTSHSTEGNGLGLALVKRVVDILKCEMAVESTLGMGTEFTVRIPSAE